MWLEQLRNACALDQPADQVVPLRWLALISKSVLFVSRPEDVGHRPRDRQDHDGHLRDVRLGCNWPWLIQFHVPFPRSVERTARSAFTIPSQLEPVLGPPKGVICACLPANTPPFETAAVEPTDARNGPSLGRLKDTSKCYVGDG